MLSFVGRGMCTSVSADQRSDALGAWNAGECRLAQDGLEHDEAGAGVDERQEEQGDEEESGKRAADHFEEPGPLVVERVHSASRKASGQSQHCDQRPPLACSSASAGAT